jgi:CO/xanthine dehydrogenase Mo-binding subunit
MWRGHAGQSAATVTVNEDGSFRVIHGAIDISGTDTAFAQIAAETLGVPLDRVTIAMGDTDSTAIVEGTWGSRTTYGQGTAIQQACEQVKQKIIEVTAAEWDVEAGEVEIAGGEVRCGSNEELRRPLKEAIQAALQQRGGIIGTGTVAQLPINPALNCQIVELEVDPETGFVEILDLVAAQDVGRAINPAMVEGQIEGGAVQGLGFALWEEYLYAPSNGDGNGRAHRLLNPNFLDYRMPTAPDVGNIRAIVVEMPVADGPFGAKGVGEAPIIPTAAAVANAVYDAVGVRITELPITPEKLLKALQARNGP